MSPSASQNGREPRAPMCQGRRKGVSCSSESQFTRPLPLCSAGPSEFWVMPVTSSLSLPVRTLISARNNLTDTPRSDVLPAIRASLIPLKLAHKIDHQSPFHIPSSHICIGHTSFSIHLSIPMLTSLIIFTL